MTAQATYQWLTTAPNPAAHRGTPFWNDYDQGQRGWRLHAVEATEDETFPHIRFRRAACGLQPSHGWDIDLFIDRRCWRCVSRLEVATDAEVEAQRQHKANVRRLRGK